MSKFPSIEGWSEENDHTAISYNVVSSSSPQLSVIGGEQAIIRAKDRLTWVLVAKDNALGAVFDPSLGVAPGTIVEGNGNRMIRNRKPLPQDTHTYIDKLSHQFTERCQREDNNTLRLYSWTLVGLRSHDNAQLFGDCADACA